MSGPSALQGMITVWVNLKIQAGVMIQVSRVDSSDHKQWSKPKSEGANLGGITQEKFGF